jgi:hypothetical protein
MAFTIFATDGGARWEKKRYANPKGLRVTADGGGSNGHRVQLGEIGALAGQDQATAWAQKAMAAKNTLTTADRGVVETAFAARVADGIELACPLGRLGGARFARPGQQRGGVAYRQSRAHAQRTAPVPRP